MQMPWMLLRDFNVPLSQQDKQGGAPITNYKIFDFQDFVIRSGLEDLHQMGVYYTWTNTRIFSKLDCVMVNKQWMELEDQWIANFQAPWCLSSYTPCLVSMLPPSQPRKNTFTKKGTCIGA